MHEPDHTYPSKLITSFAQAISIYKKTMKLADSADVWVLFVCEDDERNVCDQKVIEVELQNKYNIRSMRRTLV